MGRAIAFSSSRPGSEAHDVTHAANFHMHARFPLLLVNLRILMGFIYIKCPNVQF